MIRKMLFLLLTAALTACSSSDGGQPLVDNDTGACSNTSQKQFVLDAMRDWYLWNDRLPAAVDLDGYSSPEELLSFLVTFSPPGSSGRPIDAERGFSFIGSAAADQQFFGEGKFEGFGFSSRFVASDDLRLTRVFEDSPAFGGGLARGQRVVAIDGRSIAEIQAAEGVGNVLDTQTLTFTMRPVAGAGDGSDDFDTTITQAVVTIDPVPNWRIIDAAGGRKVGYMELATFISTADAEMDQVFAQFGAENVNEVILDLRYNGGGLVNTAELLGDLLGGAMYDGFTFSKTLFNADRSAANDDEEFFEARGSSISLSNLVIIASRGTASASELVTNSMDPYVTGGVSIVGDSTFGKPVGQIGLEFCEKILRPTSFQTVNADDFGDYFDGLPLDCGAADDLDVATGADDDPNVVAALSILEGTGCPASPATAFATARGTDAEMPRFEHDGRPERVYADAW